MQCSDLVTTPMVSPINSGITYAVITPQSLSSFQMSSLGDRFVIIYINICPSSPARTQSWVDPGADHWLTPVQIEHKHQFSSLNCHVRLFVTPWTAACQASLSITNSPCLLKLMSIELVMPSNHLILCCPLPLLPSIIPSSRILSNESVLCIRGPKYWNFSVSINPSNEYSGLISFRIDWLDLLAVQGTLKSFSNTTVQKHQFLNTQLSLWSNSYIHTWLLEKP